MGKRFLSKGYKTLLSFEKDIVPTFIYDVNGINVEKRICMEYGKNTVCIHYTVKNGNKHCKLSLAPVLNFRDFHSLSTEHEFLLEQIIKQRKVKAIIDNNRTTPVYFYASCGNYYEHHGDTFKNMYYPWEEKRGFYSEENHIVAGRYEIEIEPNEEKKITFVCSLEENIEEIDGEKVIEKEKKRIKQIVDNTGLLKKPKTKEEANTRNLIETLLKQTDTFLVYRDFTRLHTIIAGYHWFLDWGRDALISFEGLLLITKRFDMAKEVLKTFTRDIKFGLVPNGYSGYDNRPLYNSVDSSLLLFEQIKKYLNYTNDYVFVKEEFYDKLKTIIHSYEKGIDYDDNNIYLDKDGLLVSGTEKTQNTWMDAKVSGFVVTPRNGKAVEINSLWYNALCILEELAIKFCDEETEKYSENLAKKCKKNFVKSFYNKTKKCLYDVVGDSKVRPNQMFSVALSYPVLDPSSKYAKEMLETVKTKLKNRCGLKTLAKGEQNYIDIYSGDSFKRDMSYHQGITWPWLLGIFVDGWKKIIEAEKNERKKQEQKDELAKYIKTLKKTFSEVVSNGICVGSIPELFDSKMPYKPGGTISQAWSVAEVLRILCQN